MHISVHYRLGPNKTNMRSECIAKGFEALGHDVTYHDRATSVNSDLVVQTAFHASNCLRDAIDRQVPYLIMEAGPFRSLTKLENVSSWGYNGLAGGAWRPPVPEEARSCPVVEPMKTEGGILIMGQVPTDHSLRGTDHVAWLAAKFAEYPEAQYRGHPRMEPGQASLASALEEALQVITYTSTSAVEAAVAGCEVKVEGPGSWWSPYDGESREETIHRLSWYVFTHDEYTRTAPTAWIISGYEEAKARMEAGQREIPREKVNGQAISAGYHQLAIQRRAQQEARE